MRIYNYQDGTGAFLSESDAAIDPLETAAAQAENPDAEPVYLMPALATTIAPPEFGPGQWPVFRDEAWTLVPDYRGEVWFTEDGAPRTVLEVGDPAEQGLLRVPSVKPRTSDDVKAEAYRALEESDIIVLRSFEADLPVPEEWKAYRRQLRLLTGSETPAPDTVVPSPPEKPAWL
jgi:hypothetical protein